MRALLDVNVLVALLDAAHVHHGAASSWLDRNLERGWASCPITQNGCLRVLFFRELSTTTTGGGRGRATARGHGHALS